MNLLISRALLVAGIGLIGLACTSEATSDDDDDDDDDGSGGSGGSGQPLPPSCEGPLASPAHTPRPTDGETDWHVSSESGPPLQWREDGTAYDAHEDWVYGHDSDCGDPAPLIRDLLHHDIYFGTTPEPPLYRSQVPLAEDPQGGVTWVPSEGDYRFTFRVPEPVVFGTTYYWKIVGLMPNGATEGPVFTFYTEPNPVCPGMPTVNDASGYTYPTVQIGDDCWMRENLRVGVSGTQQQNQTLEKSCAEQSTGPDCFGMYNWNELTGYDGAAPSGCPSGWRLPSQSELEAAMSEASLMDPQFHGFFASYDSPEGACGYYWSSSPKPGLPTSAMVVKRCYSGDQETKSMNKESYEMSARCLRN